MSKKIETKQESFTDTKATQTRSFGSSIKIYSDQFKASLEKMKRNDAWNKDEERLVDIEHVHFFRTYDSDGKRHETMQSVGGHTHKVEWRQNAEGAAEILSVSGPVKPVRRKIKGKYVIQFDPIGDYDDHTHELIYVRSDVVEARKTNPQAAQYLGAEAQKEPQPLAGIASIDRS